MASGKRMIDANALSDAICGIGKDMKRPRAVELACLALIAEAPTVDAVEVVRCRECRYWDDDGRCEAPENGLVRDYTMGVDFCSYGEKR